MKIVLTNDGSRTLFCDDFGESYHSMAGAFTESNHVFLTGSGVRQRLAQRLPTRILEIGFGAGLNFFVTADFALSQNSPLDYVGMDCRAVPVAALRDLGYSSLIQQRELIEQFIRQSTRCPAQDQPTTWFEFGSARLNLLMRDARELPAPSFDCIFHDAFSPRANPELWSTDFLSQLGERLVNNGRVVTYCCSSTIQRRFRESGFVVQTHAGPAGGKRQMLVATRRPA